MKTTEEMWGLYSSTSARRHFTVSTVTKNVSHLSKVKGCTLINLTSYLCLCSEKGRQSCSTGV